MLFRPCVLYPECPELQHPYDSRLHCCFTLFFCKLWKSCQFRDVQIASQHFYIWWGVGTWFVHGSTMHTKDLYAIAPCFFTEFDAYCISPWHLICPFHRTNLDRKIQSSINSRKRMLQNLSAREIHNHFRRNLYCKYRSIKRVEAFINGSI